MRERRRRADPTTRAPRASAATVDRRARPDEAGAPTIAVAASGLGHVSRRAPGSPRRSAPRADRAPSPGPGTTTTARGRRGAIGTSPTRRGTIARASRRPLPRGRRGASRPGARAGMIRFPAPRAALAGPPRRGPRPPRSSGGRPAPSSARSPPREPPREGCARPWATNPPSSRGSSTRCAPPGCSTRRTPCSARRSTRTSSRRRSRWSRS